MHITVPQNELDQAATIVSSLSSRSTGPHPALGSLLIEAGEHGVQLRGTDFESMVQVNVQAKIERPGRIIVAADTFRDLIKLLPPKSEVVFEEVSGKAHIFTEDNEYNLMTDPADDFPDWNTEEPLSSFQVSQKVLKSMLEATIYALPIKDHRRVLLGVHFDLADNRLQLTATDGKKLGRVTTPIPEVEGQQKITMTVPRKLAENLVRSLGNEGPAELELGERQITARFSNVLYRCNALEGKYPDCDAVIPKEFPIRIVLNRESFLQSARRAGVVTDEKNRSIILTFRDNKCHFRSMAHDVGNFHGDLKLDYTEPELEIAFNFQFLAETLSSFSDPNVILHVKTRNTPVVFKSREDDNRLALLMPIKLSEARAGAGAAAGAEAED